MVAHAGQLWRRYARSSTLRPLPVPKHSVQYSSLLGWPVVITYLYMLNFGELVAEAAGFASCRAAVACVTYRSLGTGRSICERADELSYLPDSTRARMCSIADQHLLPLATVLSLDLTASRTWLHRDVALEALCFATGLEDGNPSKGAELAARGNYNSEQIAEIAGPTRDPSSSDMSE